jgi:molecular chaperone GrpE
MKKDPINNIESNKEIEDLQNKISSLEEGWRRTQADFDNYRKRTETQKLEMIDFAKADFMAQITPVLDNFRRAFEHLDISDPKIAGIKQIEKQLEDILSNEGLKKIDTTGEFNPNLHEAISYENNADIPTDHIIAEAESGWEFGERIIKPAKVRVSKGK